MEGDRLLVRAPSRAPHGGRAAERDAKQRHWQQPREARIKRGSFEGLLPERASSVLSCVPIDAPVTLVTHSVDGLAHHDAKCAEDDQGECQREFAIANVPQEALCPAGAPARSIEGGTAHRGGGCELLALLAGEQLGCGKHGGSDSYCTGYVDPQRKVEGLSLLPGCVDPQPDEHIVHPGGSVARQHREPGLGIIRRERARKGKRRNATK